MKKRMITASLTGALVLSATAALATPVISDTVGIVGNTYVERYIALEAYSNTVGINADKVPFFVKTSADNLTGGAINLQVVNGQVNEGAGQLFLATTAATLLDGGACAAGPTSVAYVPGTQYLVGESAAQGVVTPVTITIYDQNTFCVRNNLGTTTVPGSRIIIPSGSVFTTAHGTVTNTAPQLAVTTSINSINLSVNAGLGPDCTTSPEVKLAYVTTAERTDQIPVLKIIPQIVAGPTSSAAFTASLDSDASFQTFLPQANIALPANRVLASGLGVAVPPATSFVSVIDQQTQGIYNPATNTFGAPAMFNSFIATTAPTALTFAISSAATEPGVTASYNGVNMPVTATPATPSTPAIPASVWTATNADTLANITNLGSRALFIANNGVASMNPTVFNLSAFTLSVNGVATCVAYNAPLLGTWTGGLEAYVPFVKEDAANNYHTFIKLANRYSKDAVLFVAAMSGSNASAANVVTSTKQLTTGATDLTKVPAKGQITISGADFVANNVITAAEGVSGAAVKLLLRVPTQLDPTSAAIADPYISGVVVSTFVAGGNVTGQRSINLLFKANRNGALVAN
jgi:hypothetical protein